MWGNWGWRDRKEPSQDHTVSEGQTGSTVCFAAHDFIQIAVWPGLRLKTKTQFPIIQANYLLDGLLKRVVTWDVLDWTHPWKHIMKTVEEVSLLISRIDIVMSVTLIPATVELEIVYVHKLNSQGL